MIEAPSLGSAGLLCTAAAVDPELPVVKMSAAVFVKSILRPACTNKSPGPLNVDEPMAISLPAFNNVISLALLF